MNTRISRSLACLVLGLVLPGPGAADYRIAYSADGNQHDADDWHASPMALALLAEAGEKHRLVHFDYNNHLGDNDAWRAGNHHEAVTGAMKRYGYDPSRFFDDQRDVAGAVASIAAAIDRSSADDRLFLLCAGPMEVCWRGIDAARDDKEPFVTVVSHGRWNEHHQDTPELEHVWADIDNDFDVDAREIHNQNDTALRSDPADWDWLRRQRHGTWLYHAIVDGRKAGDASDAGMVFYVISGARPSGERATMGDIRTVFAGGDG